jgi:hypothetical protein
MSTATTCLEWSVRFPPQNHFPSLGYTDRVRGHPVYKRLRPWLIPADRRLGDRQGRERSAETNCCSLVFPFVSQLFYWLHRPGPNISNNNSGDDHDDDDDDDDRNDGDRAPCISHVLFSCDLNHKYAYPAMFPFLHINFNRKYVMNIMSSEMWHRVIW